MKLLIKVGSITNAQRSVKILSSKGYKAQMKRVSPGKSDSGCGWAVVTDAQDKDVVEILENAGIKVRGAERL